MGVVIEFEGIDGSGKTTQTRLLYEYLHKKGINVESVTSSEKELTPYILKFIKEKGAQPIEVITLLSAANDFSIVNRLAEPDKFFILDRYIYTSIAVYCAMKSGSDWAQQIYSNFKKPDLVILLDVPTNIAAQRKKGFFTLLEEGSSLVYKDAKFNGFDEFQNIVRSSYLNLAQNNSVFKVLNGQKSEIELSEQIKQLVKPFI